MKRSAAFELSYTFNDCAEYLIEILDAISFNMPESKRLEFGRHVDAISDQVILVAIKSDIHMFKRAT